MNSRHRVIGFFTLACVVAVCAIRAVATQPQQKPQPPTTPWADWVEPDFPFFSSVLDARKAGPRFPDNNLTPRALILNLGHGLWAAFDTDLLRVAAVWRGNGVTPKALAPGSYHQPDKKTPGGQTPAPEPDGTVWIANGIYSGWQIGPAVTSIDPREPAPSPEEVGRGALPPTLGSFKAVRIVNGAAILDYTVADTDVREWISASPDGTHVARQFHVNRSARVLSLIVGCGDGRQEYVQTPAHEDAVEFRVVINADGTFSRDTATQPWP